MKVWRTDTCTSEHAVLRVLTRMSRASAWPLLMPLSGHRWCHSQWCLSQGSAHASVTPGSRIGFGTEDSVYRVLGQCPLATLCELPGALETHGGTVGAPTLQKVHHKALLAPLGLCCQR